MLLRLIMIQIVDVNPFKLIVRALKKKANSLKHFKC